MAKEKKTRGGQHGNKNALKHGFYQAYFRQAEKRDFDRFEDETLDSEIKLIRATIRRLARNILPKLDSLTEEDVPIANLLLNSTKTLGTLKRTQAILTHGLSDVEEAILQAIMELEDE